MFWSIQLATLAIPTLSVLAIYRVIKLYRLESKCAKVNENSKERRALNEYISNYMEEKP